MLKQFGALPTEERARNMKGRDYLWCLTNLLLDREEVQERLCPSCRARAAQEHCPVCGRTTGQTEGADNPAFDWERYRRLREGERL